MVDYILDGLIEYLELERELGVKSVECDKSLLDEPKPKTEVEEAVIRHSPTPTLNSNSTSNPSPSPTNHHFVFLHDRPLSPKAVEMMSKIIVALGETAESAPIIIEKPVPKAPIYVVLGGRALAKFMPGKKAGPGDWIKSDGGRDVLVTYSPEYILRFDGVSATTQQIKQSMWKSLKAVKQRVESRK